MREACASLGGDPKKINPQIPCDLVIDHSVIADVAGCAGCLEENMRLEHERNAERYNFLKWAQESFENVRIVPPGMGICHQLNIEKFAQVVMKSPSGATGEDGSPRRLLRHSGGDGLPYAHGKRHRRFGMGRRRHRGGGGGPRPTHHDARAPCGRRQTDRQAVRGRDGDGRVAHVRLDVEGEGGVVGCFVECFGEGVSSLSATQRACVSNMTPGVRLHLHVVPR